MARTPDVGDPAPDFTLASNKGEIRLSSEVAKGAVLLVFYPGDDTPVCTRQLCDYRDNLETFEELDVNVLAINPQSAESHGRFAEKHALPFPLLSDPKGAVCRQYGALNFLGMARRALVLIGRDGRIVWRRVDLPIFRRTADEIREAVRDLNL